MSTLPPIDWETPGTGSSTSDIKNADIRVSVAGDGAVVPVLYGEAFVPAQIGLVTKWEHPDTKKVYLVVLCVWCVGRINQINTIYFNDKAITTDVLVANYLGATTQGIDPTLKEVVPFYKDNLVFRSGHDTVGVAYSVLRIPPQASFSFPRITALVKGRYVQTTSGGQVYSANPALILADFVRDPIIGLGRAVPPQSVVPLSVQCNETLAPTGEFRHRMGLLMSEQNTVAHWLETLRVYSNAIIGFEGNQVKLVPANETTSTPISITSADMVEASFALRYRQQGAPPTVCTITYSDRSVKPYVLTTYTEIMPGAGDTIPWREQSLSLPGIYLRSQAVREARITLNRLHMTPLAASWQAFDQGVKFSVGDRVNITHPLGLNAVQFRVVGIRSVSSGRWEITAEQFDIAVQDNGTYPETPPGVVIPPGDDTENALKPPTSITLTEVFDPSNAIPPKSYIKATWLAVRSEQRKHYMVSYRDTQTTVEPGEGEPQVWSVEQPVALEFWYSPLLVVNRTYQIRIKSVALNDVVGDYAYKTITLKGMAAPDFKPNMVTSTGGGDCFHKDALPFAIRLNWMYPGGDASIRTVQINYNTVANVSGSKRLVDLAPPTSSYTLTGLDLGTKFYFFLRFVNTNGKIGPWHSEGGTPGAASCKADVLLNYLNGQIQSTHLHQTLTTLIDEKYDDNTPAIIQMKSSIDGMEGEWALKIQSGNYVAGIGLNVDPNGPDGVRSNFIVRADRFAVGHPTETDGPEYPFIIQGGKVYIAKAAIGDAWIENANIKNLTISNAKVAMNAITSHLVVAKGKFTVDGNNFADLISIDLNLYDAYSISVLANTYCNYSAANKDFPQFQIEYGVLVDGVEQRVDKTSFPLGPVYKELLTSQCPDNPADGWCVPVYETYLSHYEGSGIIDKAFMWGKNFKVGSMIPPTNIKLRMRSLLVQGVIYQGALIDHIRTNVTILITRR